MTLFSKVFLTWSTCLDNYFFFFFWAMSCGISSPFVVPSDLSLWRQEPHIQTVQSERLLPRHGMCQIAAWRGLQLQYCKGTEYSARCPLHPVLPEQSACCVTAMCHLQICTGLHIFCSANQGMHSSETRVLEGRECTPSFNWKNPGTFPTFFLNRARHPIHGFKSVHSVIVCAAFLKIWLPDNFYLENHI